jgi:hypothetical protein
LWDNSGIVTTRIRYILSYFLGVVIWGIIFYALLYRSYGWDAGLLQRAFLALAVVLGAAQWALYYNERIRDYRRRLRYIFGITFLTTMVLAGLVAWWVFSRFSLPWRAVVIILLPAFLVASATTWAAYRVVLHFRIGEKAHGLSHKDH